MPIECEQLRHMPYALDRCKHCNAAIPEFMRGQVQSWWRRILGLPYCAVICHECKEITGWEKP